MNKKELEFKKWCVSRAIQHAESVLHIFEEKYPEDECPRKALEAAKRWLKEPTEENRELAAAATVAAPHLASAADAAFSAAAAAATYATTDATYTVAFAAAAAARQKERTLQAKKLEELGLGGD